MHSLTHACLNSNHITLMHARVCVRRFLLTSRFLLFPTVDQVKLPGDFRWEEDWRVDKTYTSTDGDGWSYGGSFGTLEQQLERGESSGANSTFDFARRRRWVRASRRVDKVVAWWCKGAFKRGGEGLNIEYVSALSLRMLVFCLSLSYISFCYTTLFLCIPISRPSLIYRRILKGWAAAALCEAEAPTEA